MPDIKVRDAVKGTIKAIDKSAVASERMKNAYVRTKEKAERSIHAAEGSPEEYAADRLSGGIETAAYGAVHEADRTGRKAVRHVKDRISQHRESATERKAKLPKKRAAKRAEKASSKRAETKVANRAAITAENTAEKAQVLPTEKKGRIGQKATAPMQQAPCAPKVESPKGAASASPIKTDRHPLTIRTREAETKTVKQTAKSSGRAAIKTPNSGIKTTRRSVKTADRSGRTAIKTADRSARQAQAAAKTAAKTAQKTAQKAKIAAKKAAEAAKRTAKLTAKAVRAIIAAIKELILLMIAGGWVTLVVILFIVLFGAALALFGGGSSSSSYTPVSAEVEAYTPIIRNYARQYGIEEYTELIKAVMMQESGGRGLDPMQSSESGYNTRYPREPNGITDPAYSIEVGVQTLVVCLSEAQVENPIDMARIKLALQGYNYGNGFIPWAITNYGGYSIAAAVEFSDMQAANLGWNSYGDKQYAAHVLRYYPYGRAFSAGGNTVIVELALTQLGNEGGEIYWSWWGYTDRVEWCAIFVSWCADQCGYLEAGIIPRFQGVDAGSQWFMDNGHWQDNSYEPSPGDLIFFDWEVDGDCDHVGIVEKCEDGIVYTVEGNSGDACRQQQYGVGSSNIFGYGLPEY